MTPYGTLEAPTSESEFSLTPEEKAAIQALMAIRPPERLSVSEWADKNRVLSGEASAEPGRWRTDRAPYQRGIMDAFSDPAMETIVVMSSAQVGKTEFILNIAGYTIDLDPAPMLFVLPTVEMAQTMSKDRLAPMVRTCPALVDKVAEPKAKSGGNTILKKSFPGGHISMTGANSPNGLAMMPAGKLLMDEVDRFPVSAGSEGDPVDLAIERTKTFWNRKIGMTSTPTIKNHSRIEKAYEASDRRRYHVPCPHCGTMQPLNFSNLVWDKDDEGNHLPETAAYACYKCGATWDDADKVEALGAGEWIAEAPFTGTAGFHLSELYSPWSTFAAIVKKFLDAKRRGAEAMRVFVNTCLGETFEEEGEGVDDAALVERREQYAAHVPAGAAVITAGVDVQDDRLEIETVAWGPGEESWNVDYRVIHGDPAQPQVWKDLDEYLAATFEHETGARLPIHATGIDTGGHHTKTVYEYVRRRQGKRIYALKGASTAGAEPVKASARKNRAGRVRHFNVGTDTLKSLFYARLRIEEEGPGFCHFPEARDEEYFSMLTAEKVVTKYRHGYASRVWVKLRPRNEALDCRVYSHVALLIARPNLDRRLVDLERRADQEENQHTEPEPIEPAPSIRRNRTANRRKGGFAKSW